MTYTMTLPINPIIPIIPVFFWKHRNLKHVFLKASSCTTSIILNYLHTNKKDVQLLYSVYDNQQSKTLKKV